MTEQHNMQRTLMLSSPTSSDIQPAITVKLDFSAQRLHLDTMEEESSFEPKEQQLYPTIAAIDKNIDGFASTALLLAKAKQFNDGLMAAIELLCQNGTENFLGKRNLLRKLSGILQSLVDQKDISFEEGDVSRSFLAAAGILCGQVLDDSASIAQLAEDQVRKFLDDKSRAKPISFYTWSDELSQIFQQDRFLQTPLMKISPHLPVVLGAALVKDPEVGKAYVTYLQLIQKLTNPYPEEYRDLTYLLKIDDRKKYCFFPPSYSMETEIVKRLFGHDSLIPEDFSLIEHLIKEIQSGKLNLSPKKESGWLDLQLWTLEPFVIPWQMPEALRLSFSHSYREKLLDAFKAGIALLRETHIKQLEEPMFGSSVDMARFEPYKIRPQISVEPTVSYFNRQAKSYQLLRQVLEKTFGVRDLKKCHRLTEEGPAATPLADEIVEMESLFWGMYQLAAAEIGLQNDSDAIDANWRRTPEQQQSDIQRAQRWCSSYVTDPDLARDNRMMVPLFYDKDREQYKVWVVLGYKVSLLKISYDTPPSILAVTDSSGKRFAPELEDKIHKHINFESTEKYLVTPVSQEAYVDTLLDREEFRNLCDSARDSEEIIQLLTGHLSQDDLEEEARLETVFPFAMHCNELGGGYISLDDGSFHMLSQGRVARLLKCDSHIMVENRLAEFLRNLDLPGLDIVDTPVLRNRNMDGEYDTHKKLIISNNYRERKTYKRDLRQDNIWKWQVNEIIVTASLKEKLIAAGFSYLGFWERSWEEETTDFNNW